MFMIARTPARLRGEQTKRHTHTLGTEAANIHQQKKKNPNKETSCFLELNTTQTSVLGAACKHTHTHIHKICSLPVGVHASDSCTAVCVCVCLCMCPATPLAAPSVCKFIFVTGTVCECASSVRARVSARDGEEGGRADDRVGFSDSLECEAAFTALSEQPE